MSDEQNNLPETPEVKPRGFSNKKNIIIIALAAVLALGGGITAVSVGAANRAERSSASGIQLAERYLSELNYTQAIIEFQRVLEIEPRNVEAYLGLAKAYVGLGDTEKALEALRKGLEMTGDSRIQEMIDELTKPGASLGFESTVSSSKPVQSLASSNARVSSSKPVESSSSLAVTSSKPPNSFSGSNSSSMRPVESSQSTISSLSTIGSSTDRTENPPSTAVDNEPVFGSMGTVTILGNDFDIATTTSLRKNGSSQVGDEELYEVAKLVNLTKLELMNYGLISKIIYDISPLASLTKLTYLGLENNDITDISAVAVLTELSVLNMSGNTIEDISPLSNLHKLNHLGMSAGKINDLSPLSNLTDLTCLYMDKADEIIDLEPLRCLTNLSYLRIINGNKITDLSPLEDLTNLKILSINSDNITDITPIAKLKNLSVLYLRGKNVSNDDIEWLKTQLPDCRFDNIYGCPQH